MKKDLYTIENLSELVQYSTIRRIVSNELKNSYTGTNMVWISEAKMAKRANLSVIEFKAVLKKARTNYNEITLSVKIDLVKYWVANTKLSYKNIATLIKCSGEESLSKFFKDNTGKEMDVWLKDRHEILTLRYGHYNEFIVSRLESISTRRAHETKKIYF